MIDKTNNNLINKFEKLNSGGADELGQGFKEVKDQIAMPAAAQDSLSGSIQGLREQIAANRSNSVQYDLTQLDNNKNNGELKFL